LDRETLFPYNLTGIRHFLQNYLRAEKRIKKDYRKPDFFVKHLPDWKRAELKSAVFKDKGLTISQNS
jgi:hypothetical protein